MGDQVQRDEFSILEATSMLTDREMSRERWLEECFPPWGTYLNQQIETTVPEKGKVALWWFGGPSWALKSNQDTFIIDNYAGPSVVTRYDNCGVCQTTGADCLHWLRLNPQVVDIWKFKRIDAAFSTHHHADHCDIYTVKAMVATTEALFVGPKITCQIFRKWGVPEERIREVRPGDKLKFPDTEVVVEKNYDQMVIKTTTGLGSDSGALNMDDAAVTFIFKSSGGNVAFVGDAIYDNAFRGVGQRNEIDVTIVNMGHNAPGGTDKLSPFDAFRVAEALGSKIVIPDHYENWASSVVDPEQLEWIVKQNNCKMKTVILKAGARFIYPDDQDISRYSYPDWVERYNWKKSIDYGTPK